MFITETDEWAEYVRESAGWYIQEIIWSTASLKDGYSKGYATEEEIWDVLIEKDIESVFLLYSSLGGTEDEMKEYFESVDVDPDQVDSL